MEIEILNLDFYLTIVTQKTYEKKFKHLAIRVECETKQSLKNLFGNPKNLPESFEKLEIYEIYFNDYNKKFYSESRRIIRKRYSEHLAPLKFGRRETSS